MYAFFLFSDSLKVAVYDAMFEELDVNKLMRLLASGSCCSRKGGSAVCKIYSECSSFRGSTCPGILSYTADFQSAFIERHLDGTHVFLLFSKFQFLLLECDERKGKRVHFMIPTSFLHHHLIQLQRTNRI